MNVKDVHQRARQLILDREATALDIQERRWLEDHIDQCTNCGVYAQEIGRGIAILRMASEMPSATLVRTTERSVQLFAGNLGEAESRRRMIVVSSFVAAGWGFAVQPYLWRLFGWVGGSLGLPAPAWQAAFVAMWLLPGIVSVLLLTHLPLPSRILPQRGRSR